MSLTNSERLAHFMVLTSNMLEFTNKVNLAEMYEVEHELDKHDFPKVELSPFADIQYRDYVITWLVSQPVEVAKAYTVAMLFNLQEQEFEGMESAHAGSTIGAIAFMWQQFDLALKFCAISRKIASDAGQDLRLSDLVIETTLKLYGEADSGESFIQGMRSKFANGADELWNKYFLVDMSVEDFTD